MAYKEQCIKLGPPFIEIHPATKNINYVYVRRQLTESNVRELKSEMEASNSYNVWEQKALEAKAKRHYALARGMTLPRI